MGKNLIKTTAFRFTDQSLIGKIDEISKKHKRNRNQEVEWILSEYVAAYEQEHGCIEVPEQ